MNDYQPIKQIILYVASKSLLTTTNLNHKNTIVIIMLEDYGIYKIWYDDFIHPNKELIGKEIIIVKGRKYPIGTKHTIKSFTTWIKPMSYGKIKTEYLITTDGLKINIENCKLVKALPKHDRIIKECYGDFVCPNCKSDKIYWHGDGLCPAMDLYASYYNCKNCGLDI